jgi:hypothetical protein
MLQNKPIMCFTKYFKKRKLAKQIKSLEDSIAFSETHSHYVIDHYGINHPESKDFLNEIDLEKRKLKKLKSLQ